MARKEMAGPRMAVEAKWNRIVEVVRATIRYWHDVMHLNQYASIPVAHAATTRGGQQRFVSNAAGERHLR